MRKELLKLQLETKALNHSDLSKFDQLFLRLIHKSIAAAFAGNYPVAAGIANAESNKLELIRSNNSFTPYFNSSGHAEMNTISAQERTKTPTKNITLFITLEPCLMCMSRIALSRINQIVYLTKDPAGGGIGTGHKYPSDFAIALKRKRFIKHEGNAQLQQIGNELYAIGEKLWQRQLRRM